MTEKDEIDETEKTYIRDTSLEHEISMLIENLVAIEEHIGNTMMGLYNKIDGLKEKEGKEEEIKEIQERIEKYSSIYDEVRKIRAKYLRRIIENGEGENWCEYKHYLVSRMHLTEIGTKYFGRDNGKSLECFEDGQKLYTLMWATNKMLEED